MVHHQYQDQNFTRVEQRFSRSDFLKNIFAGVALAVACTPAVANAASKTVFTDNLDTSPGVYQDVKPPASTKLLWLNVGAEHRGICTGEIAYYDSEKEKWLPANRYAFLKETYPVGSIYITTNSKNPGEYIRNTGIRSGSPGDPPGCL